MRYMDDHVCVCLHVCVVHVCVPMYVCPSRCVTVCDCVSHCIGDWLSLCVHDVDMLSITIDY